MSDVTLEINILTSVNQFICSLDYKNISSCTGKIILSKVI